MVFGGSEVCFVLIFLVNCQLLLSAAQKSEFKCKPCEYSNYTFFILFSDLLRKHLGTEKTSKEQVDDKHIFRHFQVLLFLSAEKV